MDQLATRTGIRKRNGTIVAARRERIIIARGVRHAHEKRKERINI